MHGGGIHYGSGNTGRRQRKKKLIEVRGKIGSTAFLKRANRVQKLVSKLMIEDATKYYEKKLKESGEGRKVF